MKRHVIRFARLSVRLSVSVGGKVWEVLLLSCVRSISAGPSEDVAEKKRSCFLISQLT